MTQRDVDVLFVLQCTLHCSGVYLACGAGAAPARAAAALAKHSSVVVAVRQTVLNVLSTMSSAK